MYLAFVLALVSIPITASLAGLLILVPLVLVERRIQWQNKSSEEWAELGVTCPGVRLPLVSVFFCAVGTTFTKSLALVVAALVFAFYKQNMPFLFVGAVTGLLLLHNIGRMIMHAGDSRRWRDVGYLIGDLVGVLIGATVVYSWIVS